MSCPQCQGLEDLFDNKTATKELKTYRKKGPGKTTKLLIDALMSNQVKEMTLLDIGGGVGVIQHELLNAGLHSAVNVDASTAYIKAAQAESGRQGYLDKVSYHHGNFVDVAPSLPPVDIVTLDRAICCYHDMPALVEASAEKATKLYGLVYPRDIWWLKLGLAVVNTSLWLFRKPCRFFIHPTSAVEAVLQQHGLKRSFHRKTLLWQIAVFAKE